MALEDDEFTKAFAEFAEAGSTEEKDAVSTPEQSPVAEAATPGTPVEEKVAEDPASEAQVKSVEAQTGAESVPESEKVEPAPVAASESEKTEKTDDTDLLRRFAEIVKSTPEARPEPVSGQQPVEIYSADEKAVITAYEKDWPDVVRAERLIRRAEYHDLVKYVFTQVSKHLDPLATVVQTLSEKTHLGDLRQNVSDYDTVRDRVVDWASKQPPYLQIAYRHVIERGTADEVKDLVDRWRRDVGEKTTTSIPSLVKQDTELPTAAKKAAASLAPVSSKRSAVLQSDDPNDFDAAFEKFARTM